MANITSFKEQGFAHFAGLLDTSVIGRVRSDAKAVFLKQMLNSGRLRSPEITEQEFEKSLFDYFQKDREGFVNCGKTCQHLISLHRLALNDVLIDQLKEFGVDSPSICTRPVMYFNSRYLAVSEGYYKSPPHQDWRSMQGSLNATVVWVPLVDIDAPLGALQVIPGSHLLGLQDSTEDEWFRHIENTRDEQYVSVDVKAGDALFFSAFLIHRSGDNVTDSIRWSCHFRYNDLNEKTFIDRKYPNPYLYKPEQRLLTENFPDRPLLSKYFLGK